MYKIIWRLDQNCSVYLPLFISINSFLSVSGNLLFLAALINIMTPRKLERNVYFAAFLTLFSEVCHRQGDVKKMFQVSPECFVLDHQCYLHICYTEHMPIVYGTVQSASEYWKRDQTLEPWMSQIITHVLALALLVAFVSYGNNGCQVLQEQCNLAC